jgi:hypothetical protein
MLALQDRRALRLPSKSLKSLDKHTDSRLHGGVNRGRCEPVLPLIFGSIMSEWSQQRLRWGKSLRTRNRNVEVVHISCRSAVEDNVAKSIRESTFDGAEHDASCRQCFWIYACDIVV